MIDVSKCEYEESSFNPLIGHTHYFIYPRDMSEADFEPEETYGNVISMCLSLHQLEDGYQYLMLSPTIAEETGMSDVDWRELKEGENYTQETINALLEKMQTTITRRMEAV